MQSCMSYVAVTASLQLRVCYATYVPLNGMLSFYVILFYRRIFVLFCLCDSYIGVVIKCSASFNVKQLDGG